MCINNDILQNGQTEPKVVSPIPKWLYHVLHHWQTTACPRITYQTFSLSGPKGFNGLWSKVKSKIPVLRFICYTYVYAVHSVSCKKKKDAFTTMRLYDCYFLHNLKNYFSKEILGRSVSTLMRIHTSSYMPLCGKCKSRVFSLPLFSRMICFSSYFNECWLICYYYFISNSVLHDGMVYVKLTWR